MARIDVSTVVNKQRDVPKNLSSGKNSRLSPTVNSCIEDESEGFQVEQCANVSPLKQILEKTVKDEGCKDALLIQSSSQSKDEEIEQDEEGIEIQVNKMITIRQGPQLYVSPRRIRRASTTNTSTENIDMLKTLTPNEILVALVNIFSPPMGDEESPPLLDREFTLPNDPYGIVQQDMSMSGRLTTYTSHQLNETAPEGVPTHLQSSTNYSAMATSHHNSVSDSGSMASHISLKSNYKSNNSSSTKYPPLTLGGALGIRRSRAVANQSSKSGNQGSLGSDGYQGRRDSLPTRMSGPVTLEALAPSNAISPDGGSSGTGHLVSFNGQTTEVPEEIRCHLCDYPMKLCIRKSKYKGEIREYAAYRCLRKGCQTFRSVRKVIEPDLSCPRKRKPDDSAPEIFDACNVNPNLGVTPAQQTCQDTASLCDDNVGTLLFIPGKVSSKQMEAMQKFTFKFFGGATGPLETIPKPLFAYVNMTCEAVSNLLKTEAGQKKIQRLLIRSSQPPTPPFIVEEAENAGNNMTQVSTGADTSPAFVSQMGSFPINPLPMNQYQDASQLSSYSDYIPNGTYYGEVFAPVQNFYRPNVLTPVQVGSHPGCGIATDAPRYELRPPQYFKEMNW
ncbi:hypothetical protein DICVIV_06993 [Dictyocaulus viviparus]|uniref:Uncharacterized protein n=1 Tax=Dictyocaulus viviparus TaxID=29172 RepID=A0A0D8XQI6_DICVI|nr:hypothetical protein DICVIV_06993 [Dictyocaulus viviparus]